MSSSRGNSGRYFLLRREAQGRLEEGRLENGFCDRVPRDRVGRLLRLLDVSRLAGERIIAHLRHGFWENNGVLCDLERRGRDSSSDQKLEGLLSQQRLFIADNHDHNARCYGSVAERVILISAISQWS